MKKQKKRVCVQSKQVPFFRRDIFIIFCKYFNTEFQTQSKIFCATIRVLWIWEKFISQQMQHTTDKQILLCFRSIYFYLQSKLYFFFSQFFCFCFMLACGGGYFIIIGCSLHVLWRTKDYSIYLN